MSFIPCETHVQIDSVAFGSCLRAAVICFSPPIDTHTHGQTHTVESKTVGSSFSLQRTNIKKLERQKTSKSRLHTVYGRIVVPPLCAVKPKSQRVDIFFFLFVSRIRSSIIQQNRTTSSYFSFSVFFFFFFFFITCRLFVCICTSVGEGPIIAHLLDCVRRWKTLRTSERSRPTSHHAHIQLCN